MLRTVMALLAAAAVLGHTVVGCCAHHGHAAATPTKPQVASCQEHVSHSHHSTDESSPLNGKDCPTADCGESDCTFAPSDAPTVVARDVAWQPCLGTSWLADVSVLAPRFGFSPWLAPELAAIGAMRPDLAHCVLLI